MKKLLALHQGIFHYLLQHIDDAVVKGQDPFLLHDSKYVMFNAAILGLEEAPAYLSKFLVKETDYVKAQTDLPKGLGQAAVMAALHESQSSYYEQTLKRVVAAHQAKIDAYDSHCVKAAKAALVAHNADPAIIAHQVKDPMGTVNPLWTTALEACQKAHAAKGETRPTLPPMAVMAKEAKEAASAMVKAHAQETNAANLAKNGAAVAREPPVMAGGPDLYAQHGIDMSDVDAAQAASGISDDYFGYN